MKGLGFAGVSAVSFAAVLTFVSPDLVQAGVKRIEAVAAVAQPPALPDQILYLIRSTLLTLDAANRTGNYSVLRESATAEFQQRNSTADLALIFADLRRRGVDLAPVAVTVPHLSVQPVPDAQGRLRLAGQIAAGAQTVGFDLVFVVAAEHWKLDAVSIGAQPKQAQPRDTGN